MIDFVRIHYKDKSRIEPFIMNPENFSTLNTNLEYHSGEVSYPYKTYIECMEVKVTKYSVSIKNSLHKLFNVLTKDEYQNYNDFNYTSLCETIDYLSENLIEIDTTDLTQLEFGLNIKTNVPAEKIIKGNVLMHKFKGYNHNKKYDGKGEYMQFDHSNYRIKIYDKAKQYVVPENILRFEIKFSRKRDFNKLGIYRIEDLKSKDKLQKLFNYLLKRFDELQIIDDLDFTKIPKNDFTQLENYSSHKFWERLSERNYRNVKSQHKRKLKQLLNKHSLNQTQQHLRTLLNAKFQELINH